MAKIIIIGAGLTGISTAYHLEKNGFFDYKIFEKDTQIGGLCKSVYQDGFTFDYTGHLLHLNDNYCTELIKNNINLDNFNLITRKSFIYSHEKYTPYPYQTNLYGLPKEVIKECICGFVECEKEKIISQFIKNKNKKNAKSYYNWVMQNFGAGFGKHFFFPYQEKIFDFNIKKLSSTWTGRFVPNTSLESLILGCIEKSDEKIGYNSKFFYPKKSGIFYLIKNFAKHLLNPIHTNFGVKSIDTKGKKVIFNNGHTEKFDILINTMPLDNLLDSLLQNSSTIELKNASKNLLCNGVINFNFGIFSDKTYDKHWIYYPEKKHPFYRIGFFHGYSNSMAPNGCSSMYGEFSYLKKSKKFIKQKLDICLKESKKLLEVQDSEILTEKILNLEHAYVIYDVWRDKNISKIHKALNKKSIYSIGRYGQWKYSSMQEAILDGKSIVEKLIATDFENQAKYWNALQNKDLQKENKT